MKNKRREVGLGFIGQFENETFTSLPANVYARANSKAQCEALVKAYVNLVPNRESDRDRERSKNLRGWLRDLGR